MANSSLTHKFISALADGSDSSQVQPTNWNDSHKITAPDGISTNQQGVLLGTESSGELALNGIVGSGALKYLRRNSGDTAYEFGTLPTLPADGIIQTVGTTPSALSGTASQYLRRNSGNTAYEFGSLPAAPTPPTTFLFSSDYNFSAIQPGGSLIVGSNSIVLSPAPSGLVIGNYLYISGGSGTAEAVLITGWNSGTSTVIVTCANTHSGAWTIQSATAGICEAAQVLGDVGVIVLPRSPITIRTTITVKSAISIWGQGFSSNYTDRGSVIICPSGVTPALKISDALGTADFQGTGNYCDFRIYGPAAGDGLWIGTTLQTASFTRFRNLWVANFANAAILHNANFITFVDCVFAGLTIGLKIPSTANGSLQPVNFYNCLISVPTGNAVVQDTSTSSTASIQYFGGQISGTITGAAIDWHSYGTHYEPNINNEPLFTVTNAAVNTIFIEGGIMSVHGAAVPYFISMVGTGYYVLTVKNVTLQVDNTRTVPTAIIYNTSLGGLLAIENIYVSPAGVITNLYSYVNAANRLIVNQPEFAVRQILASSATLAFPIGNYPERGVTTIFPNATTITAVSGLIDGQHGIIYGIGAQIFTLGATIGNSITLTAGMPYAWHFDGTKIWIQ